MSKEKSTEMTEMQDMINMAKGLQQSAQNAAENSAGFLKFTKFGNWVFGSEATEVEEGSAWVIHPQGFRHGFIAWGDEAHDNHGEKLGEIMVSASTPLPPEDLLDEVKGKWAQQVSMQLLCIDGLDQGTKVVYNANSVGGRRVYQQVVSAVVAKISAGSTEVTPVVTLNKDSYTHKKFGVIFTPVVDIEEYMTLAELRALAVSDEGDDSESVKKVEEKAPEKKAALEEEPEAEEEDKPVRTRRTRRTR